MLASQGRMGLVQTVPSDFPADTLVSTMSILGLDPAMYYTGKAAFEAINLGLSLEQDDWVFCCDLVSTFAGSMVDPYAGDISTTEAKVLLQELNKRFRNRGVEFVAGNGYHHLAIFKNVRLAPYLSPDPFNIRGESLQQNYPQGEGSELLISIMEEAGHILAEHDINKVRRDLKENPADTIWFWGGSRLPNLPVWEELFQRKAALISAYPELQGLAKAIGLQVLQVPGMTGSWDTNWSGKVEHTLAALAQKDLVYLHIGALLTVARNGDVSQKVRLLEQIDEKVIRPLRKTLPQDTKIMVVGGHFVSIKERISTPQPVPFAIWFKDIPGGTGLPFNEKNAQKVELFIDQGCRLLPFFFNL